MLKYNKKKINQKLERRTSPEGRSSSAARASSTVAAGAATGASSVAAPPSNNPSSLFSEKFENAPAIPSNEAYYSVSTGKSQDGRMLTAIPARAPEDLD
jgi:hypothetical protein